MLLWFALSPALADSPAYFHPNDIAAQSQRFAEAASVMAPAFEGAQGVLSALGRDLEYLERNTAYLGAGAPPALTTWYDQTRRTAAGQYLQIQRHVDLLQEDYGQTFSVAVDRAVAAVGAGHELVECTASGGVSSMFRRSASGHADCQGEDLNGAIAAVIDQDTALTAELEEINAIPWPTVGVEPTAQPVHPVTGTTHYVSLTSLSRRYLKDRAEQRLEDFEDALAPIEDALDSGDPEAIAEASRLREAYLEGLSADGAILQEALLKTLTRAARRDPAMAEVGLCANPAGLGGCAGEDVTDTVMGLLRDDGRFQKTMQRL